MRIQEDDEWKTVFHTKYDYFNYQIMPFGLSNALTSFQSYINRILAKKLNIFVIVYLDNIFIYVKYSGQPYINEVLYILDKLQRHKYFANWKKCCFH